MILTNLYKRLPLIRELASIDGRLAGIRDDLTRISSDLKRIMEAELMELTECYIPRSSRYGDKLRLLRYAAQTFSQGGEDGIIAEICRRVGTTTRTFVEIGVGNGLENNTTLLLTQGWRGWWIDADQNNVTAIEARFKKWIAADRLTAACAQVTAENVMKLLNDLQVPADVDLFSLDIDRNTYWVWKATASFRPRIVVVEYNASRPPNVEWSVEYKPAEHWNGTNVFGASLKSFELLGKDLGYVLVGCTLQGVNAFFVRNDLVGDHFSAPFTAENHYEPPRYGLSTANGHRREVEE